MAADARLRLIRPLVLVAVLFGAPSIARAQVVTNTTNYDELYWRYLVAARNAKPADAWINDLTSDPSARHVNDLVTIKVIESLSATGSADANLDKSSAATADFPSPLSKGLSKALPASTDTKFKGTGTTTRTTEFSAVLTARVLEVLPNGNLVIEGVREVDINGDHSLVVLSGVVRPLDIQPGNVVPSTAIGQLRIRSLSQGLIHDSLTPGWLVRILNKVF